MGIPILTMLKDIQPNEQAFDVPLCFTNRIFACANNFFS